MGRSNKENFVGLFRGEPSDRLLWVADLTYWRDSQMIKGTLPERYEGTRGFLQLHLDLGVMPYYIYAIDDQESAGISVHQIGAPGKPYNGVFEVNFEGIEIINKRDGNKRETCYYIGDQTLVQKKEYLPQSFCQAFTEYPVKSINDLSALRNLYEHCVFQESNRGFLHLSALWGEAGVPIAPLPRSPLSALVVDWMGVVGFTFAAMDDPTEVRKTIDCIDRVNDQAFELVVRSPAEIFHFCDNLTAANYSSFFPTYAAEYYTRRFQELHRHGKKAAVHLDGTIRGILHQVAATGADAAEALTTRPVGDVAVEDLRQEAQNESLILWGGLPAVMFTSYFTHDELRAQVYRIREQWEMSPRFIAGSADQMPPDTDLESIRLVSKLFS